MTGNNVTYTYGTSGTSKGRPILVTDGTGSLKLAYDALGNVTEEARTIVLPQHGEEFRLGMLYQYDSWGRMLSMTYPDGEEITYSYQWGGDLFAMYGDKNGVFQTYIRETRYNHLGQKSYIKYGNGTSAHYTYDELHRLANLRSVDRLGNDMQDIDYTFDSASNVTGIHNNAGAVNTLGGAYNNYYTYDALHRLVSSSGAGIGGIYAMDMAYSSSGRIKEKFRDRQSTLLSESVYMFYGYCDAYQPHAVRRMFDEHNRIRYDLRWDAAGNLGQISTGNAESMFESGRFLFWTEDNRMHAAVDNSHYSYYAYDHSGERRIKLTGENSVLDVNAEIMSTLSTLDKVTLYPSAYVVLTDRGYTKHYYTGMERIAARIGDGGLNVGIYLSDTDILHARADRLFGQSLDQVNCRVLDANEMGCILDGAQDHVELGILVEEIPERMLATVGTEYGEFISAMHLISGIGESSDVYYYHSDHLGSASWITDSSGIPVQHLQYMPFGEPFVNQRIFGYSERFTFTGKERDEETGYGYFGARYMDHELMTMWLSVDPMADKYPGVSPYAYCAWNPVSLVDPDGRDIWQLDNLGNIVDFVECEDYDCIHIVDSKGIIVRSSNCYEYGTISELCLNGQNNTTFSVCGFDNAKEVFEFLANYYTKDNGTPLEWAHGTIAEMSPWSLAPNNNTNVITTTHQNSSVDLGIWLDNGYVISRQAHNHPSGSNKPSDITDGNGRRHGDVPSALSFEKRYSAVKSYTYTQTWGYSEYDSKGTLDPRILNQNSLPEVKIK